jgi:hypothetical protein
VFREYRARREAEVAAALEGEQRLIDETAVALSQDDLSVEDDSDDSDIDESDFF